ncbi:tail fiber domain-containing protein [Bacillus cereus group sp. MYBK139-2]|uniref:tail fiber domain-containing protein n=1 Tax=unclassified Bacillus cereus group TaxID=2750818 RepID=UPI003F78E1C4
MARYIRYLENGTWKYASVKSVGDLEKLLTTSKTDIVSAINELIANGGALEHDLNSRFDGLEGQQNELVTITGNVQETLGKVQDDLLNKAEALYVDEQIKKLVNKEDYDANYQKIEGELLDKVNIEKYNEEYKLVTAKLNDKTDLSAFEGVEGRVTTTEQEITNVKGELGSKIGKTEFDSAVGVNRWLARKYDINVGSAGAIPSFSHIKGKQPSEVIDYDDNSVIKPFTGDYYIGHYFTNVYMKVAKTVRLTVTNDDGAVIYMNGAKMYESTTRTTGLTVAMTFRAGWNTVEILHYEHSGAVEQVSLGLKLSEQVDKLTSVIGIGDKNDTRLVEAETQIKQNAEAILLKAEGSVVTSLGNKVTANEASINLMKDEITMLVKTEDFNKYTGRLETAESTIIQHSNQISQKVEKKDYDALNNIVGEQQTSINQLTSEISLKATKSDFDGLNGRVGNAETQIKLNTEAINLRAKQTELDKTNGRLQTAESQLNVQAGQISTKVTQEDINKSIDDLNFEVRNLILNSGFARGFESWNNTSFTILPAEADKPNSKIVKVSRTGASTNSIINLISNKGNVKNGDSVSFSVDFKVTSFSAYDVKNPFIVEFYDDAGTRVQYTDVALSNMGISTLSDGKWVRLTYTVKANNASITKVALRIALFRNGEVFYREPQMQIGTKATGYMLAPEDSLGAETRLANAESTIVQQATEIGLKANANDVYKKAEADGKVSTAITQAKGEIKIETDKISQNVTNLTQTVTTQGTTISNHETSITQMKGDINLRAEAKNVYTKTEADGKISTAVTNAKAEIKITTDGISQNVTNVKGDLSNLNDVVVAQGTQIKQTSDEVAINVVKKGNIKASINASTEGIKIGGQHVDITGQVTFSSLDSNMQGKVNAGTDAKSQIDTLRLGINNLILDSHRDFSTTNYLVNMYTLSEDLIAGEEYTFVVKGTVPAGQKFGVWMNGGSDGSWWATNTYAKGVTYVTFKAYAPKEGHARTISLYNAPQNTTLSTVDWVALYKGNKPMDWMPATSDMEKLIGGASPNIILNSGFLQGMKFWGTPATGVSLDTTIDLDGIPIIKSVQSGNTTDVWRGLETDLYPAPLDRPITFSVYSYTPDLTKLDAGMTVEIKCYDKNKARITAQTYAVTATPSKSNSWERFSKTITISGDKNIKYINLFVYVRKNGTGYFAKPMIQHGSTLGDWTPNPNDVIIDSLDTVSQNSKNAIADMSNDNKATPVEKTQLKKEWATIVAEKPQYEALATTYGITTEKTNYVNAYNALNTAVTPIIANTTVTSDINGATFRNTFDDYYDKLAQLIKKINELSRSIGTNADSKAQSAQNAIADMSSDSKITPVEKVQLKKEWAVMLSEKPQYEALATTYGITTEKTNYVNAYNTLNTVLNGTGGILTNMTTTSAVTGATFRGQFDDYYDKKAQLVKKINETSKSLADGAQGTANTANNAINNNKAIWDRASNINADGKFNTNKLSGLILDAQISSATNWNGAKSLLDSWKSGTTLINGGMIATNTIFAQQIAIGDFTNLSQINEEKNPNGYSTVLLNNKRYFKIGNGAYASLTMMDNTYVEFKVNDEYYIAFNGYRDAGLTSLNLIMRYHYTDGTWANAGVISALPTTADTRVIKNLQITTAPDDTKTISRVQLFFEKDGTAGSGYYYIRDLEVRKRYTGELIVDGSIKAQQLDVNSLFAHSGFITNLKSQEIDASKIKTGQLIGIYIRSDGTNAFSYMSGGSIVSKSKVSTVETWIDEGLVRVKSSTSMLSLSEDNLSIGQIGKSGYGSITYTAPNTDPSQNLFSIWGVGKIVLESNQNDIILKGRAHIQGVDSGGVALNFPEASSIRFDRYGNINAPSTMSSEATWSIKDADNRIRILIPMGKGTQSGNEYHSHVGGHKFLHNGTLGIATYIQGGDSPIIQFNGRSILKYWGGGNYFEFKNQWDSGFVPVYASAFNTASSLIWKTDIESYEKSALDVVMGTNIVTYKYKSDVEESDNPHTHVGVIAEYAPKEIQSKDGRGVDNYAMSSLAWKAIQELSEQVRYLKEKLNNR